MVGVPVIVDHAWLCVLGGKLDGISVKLEYAKSCVKPDAAIVILSLPEFVVRVIFEPAMNSTVSVAESAETLV